MFNNILGKTYLPPKIAIVFSLAFLSKVKLVTLSYCRHFSLPSLSLSIRLCFCPLKKPFRRKLLIKRQQLRTKQLLYLYQYIQKIVLQYHIKCHISSEERTQLCCHNIFLNLSVIIKLPHSSFPKNVLQKFLRRKEITRCYGRKCYKGGHLNDIRRF